MNLEQRDPELEALFQRAAARHQARPHWQARVLAQITTPARPPNHLRLWAFASAASLALVILLVVFLRSDERVELASSAELARAPEIQARTPEPSAVPPPQAKRRERSVAAKKVKVRCDPNDPLCGIDGSWRGPDNNPSWPDPDNRKRRDQMTETIRALEPQLAACGRKQGAEGTLLLWVVVAADSTQITFDQATSITDEVKDCVRKIFSTVRFAKSDQPTTVSYTVHY